MKPVKTVIQAFLYLMLLSCIVCIPVSAYSSEAVQWYLQGNVNLEAKNYSQAVQAYDRAVTIDPGYFEAWNAKADALNRAGNYTGALAASDQVIRLNPNYVGGWINRGFILYNLGRYDDELKAYQTAVRIDPSSPEGWFNIGYSLAGMKRYDEAIAAFDKVQNLDPSYPNLAANRRIAEQYRDSSMPFYVRYAPVLGIIIVLVAGAFIWHFALRKKK
jgi:tetratricopeptide (TPR) repeat protein